MIVFEELTVLWDVLVKKIILLFFAIFADDYFDKTPKYNKCFCDSCHKARGDKECYTRGNPPKTYALPLGCSRFAIK